MRGPSLRGVPQGPLAEDLVHQPLERINKEITADPASWASFDEASARRLVGAILADFHDE